MNESIAYDAPEFLWDKKTMRWMQPFVQPRPQNVYPYRGPCQSRMQEWSFPRASEKGTNPAKFYAAKLNDAHADFLVGDLAREEYLEQVYNFLEPDNSAADVAAFMLANNDKLETGTFCPDHKKFSTVLNRAWMTYSEKQGTQVTPNEDQEQGDATGEGIAPVLPILRPNPAGINKAYCNYVERVAGAEDKLYQLIFAHASRRIQYSLKRTHEGAEDHQDHAQQVAIAVWSKLGTFRGTPEFFYIWLKSVCANKSTDALKINAKEFKGRLPLQLQSEDGEVFDHPALRQEPERPEHRRKLPDWIQGTDKLICGYIREGDSYARIAKGLDMTETDVKNRVRAMKKRIEADKAATAK